MQGRLPKATTSPQHHTSDFVLRPIQPPAVLLGALVLGEITGQNKPQKVALPRNRKNKIAAPPPITQRQALCHQKAEFRKSCFVWMINSFIFGELQDKEPYYTLGCITRTS